MVPELNLKKSYRNYPAKEAKAFQVKLAVQAKVQWHRFRGPYVSRMYVDK